MKITINKPTQVTIKTLHAKCGVRYWGDAQLNGKEDTEKMIPCVEGDYWSPIIDIDTGIVTNWIEGNIAAIHYKVCDDGTYCLKDELGNTVLELRGYVPLIMCPDGEGDGDYVIMRVQENGQIANWGSDISDFFEE